MNHYLNFISTETRNRMRLFKKLRVWLFVWGACLLVAGTAYATINQKIHSLNQQSVEWSRENEQIGKLLDLRQSLANELHSVDQRWQQLAMADNSRATSALFGALLEHALESNKDVCLDSVHIRSITSSEKRHLQDFEITIRGVAKTEVKVADLVNRLKDDPMLNRVQLQHTGRSQSRQEEYGQDFQIICTTSLEPVGR